MSAANQSNLNPNHSLSGTPRILVLGAGAWGTAIALSLSARDSKTDAPVASVTLWVHDRSGADEIEAARENRLYLPGFPLPENLKVTADTSVISEAEIVVSVIPSAFLRSTIARIAPQLHARQIILSATKGIEDHTFLRMTEVIKSTLAEHAPHLTRLGQTSQTIPIGALSGPSFALEVAKGLPTAVTVAFHDSTIAAHVQHSFTSRALRLYSSTDLIGVELGGALKNVIAIAAGIANGLGLGHNSSSALITRGIAEITRLAVACGGRRETLAGLSGLGDLVLTCTGSLSRNRTVGIELGRGRKLDEILSSLGGKVAEGVPTTRAALGLARRHNVEMPITEQMGAILEEDKDPKVAIKELMQRPSKDE
jgi:glycerol-3-phosphate dehydrogenase (NAD(P)+)